MFFQKWLNFRQTWESIMGVGAQKDLRGQQISARKMTLNLAEKWLVFLSKLRWPQKKKKKKGLHWNWDSFSVFQKKKKGLHWNWAGLMNIKLPKILTQLAQKSTKLPKILMHYSPNNIKLPEISTLWNKAGGPVPPGPPTSYATGNHCWKNFVWI